MRLSAALCLSLCLLTPAFAQHPVVASLAFKSKIREVQTDRMGNFSVLQANGHLAMYSREGKLIRVAKRLKKTVGLEPKLLTSIFLYNPKKKQYFWVSPYHDRVETVQIDASAAFDPVYANPVSLRYLWIYDKATHMIRCINSKGLETRSEFALPEGLVVHSIREYYQMLFVHHTEGISIYEQFGKFITNIETPAISGFHFLGSDLYYTHSNQLVFFDLYRATKSQRTIPFPCANALLLPGEKIICFDDKSGTLYSFPLKDPDDSGTVLEKKDH